MDNNQNLTIIEKKTTDVVLAANQMLINSQESYNGCDAFLVTVKGIRKEIDATFDPLIADAHKHHKNLVSEKKRHDDPLAQAEQIVKTKSIAFVREQERIEEERQRKAAEAAAREEARLRKIKEDQEREWRAKEEAARREVERLQQQIAKAKTEKERAEAEAAAARANAEAEKAAAKAEEKRAAAAEVFVPVPEVEPVFEKAASQSIKKLWKCEVTSIIEVCKAIVAGTLPETMVQPNPVALNALARTMQDKKQYPGLKFYAEDSMAVRR